MNSAPTLAKADGELADDVDEYAAYIRQVTGDGEAIVDCLIRIMEDDSVGAKPYERLDAQLLLDAIGFGRLAVDQASTAPPAGAAPASPPMPAAPGPPRAANNGTPRRPVLLLSEETLFRLPPLVRQKTDKGRKMADFLNAVVRGEMSDFKPHHWIRAAKHLAARAYSREIDPERPGLSLRDAMALIDKLFPGFEPYHRADMKQIIRRGFDDMSADDDGPLNGPAASRPHDGSDSEAALARHEARVRARHERRAERLRKIMAEPVPYRPKFEALRARYEARLRAQAERRRLEDEREERRKKDDGPDPDESADDDLPRDKVPYRPWLAKRLPRSPDDCESRPGRPIGLSKWERKAMEKGYNLGWDCGIQP